MGKFIKRGKKLLNQNMGTFIMFELLYKSLFVAIAYPLFIGLFRLVLHKAGLKYLTNGYIYTFAKNPYTIAYVLFLIVVLLLYINIEISALELLFYQSYQSKKVSCVDVIRYAFSNLKNMLKKGNRIVLLHNTIIVTVCNVSIFFITISNLTLPSAVNDFLFENKILKIVYIIIGTFMLYSMLSGFFTNSNMNFKKISYKVAKKESKSVAKKNALVILRNVLLYNICIMSLYWFAILLLTILVVIFVKIFNMYSYGMVIFLSIFRIFNSGFKIMLYAFSVPGSMLVVTHLYKKLIIDKENDADKEDTTDNSHEKKIIKYEITYYKYNDKKKDRLKKYIIALITASIIADGSFVYLSYIENPFANVELMSLPEITSHRGNSVKAPENTLLAFEYAIRDMSDYIELDVQETADGELIVIHDPSLKRTTGVNKKVKDVTLTYVQTLDAGSYFDEEFAGEKVPTLAEVFELVDEQVKLNIEIKPTNENADRIAQKVVELIEEYDIADSSIITSMKYDVLKSVKKYNENIKTGYIISVAYGNFYNMAYVDAFSMNYAFVNKNTVDAVHARGKEVMVWTVNSADKIENLTALGVDNIITDDPVMAREVIYSKYSYKELVNILNYVFDK